MKIAVIGSGNIGKGLGGSLVKAGHSVSFASKGGKSSLEAAKATGGTAAASIQEAVRDAEIVILAMPYVSAWKEVSAEIASVAGGKVVIDVTNPLGADGGLATKDLSAAEEFAKAMPAARVVKALNTVFASVQGNPRALGQEVDAFIATDDKAAADTTAELLRSIGFRPVFVGPLVRARQLEAVGYLNIQIQISSGGDWRSSFVLVGAPAATTETAVSSGPSATAK